MADVLLAEGGNANSTIRVILVDESFIGLSVNDGDHAYRSRGAFSIDGVLEQAEGDLDLETRDGVVYRCVNDGMGGITFKALKRKRTRNKVLASVRMPLSYLYIAKEWAEEEAAIDEEMEKQEALDMCHAVCQRIKDRGCEPSIDTDDPVERQDAEWLDEMRLAKTAWEASEKGRRN